MKVLILSVRVGSGHTAIAKSTAKCFEDAGDTVVIKEMFENDKYHNWLISDLGFKSIFAFPHIANHFYDNALKTDKHVYHKFVKSVSAELISLVNKFSPDIIISTHIAGRIFVNAYREKFQKPVISYLISTDYELPPGIVEPQKDDYIIVPNEDFVENLKSKGFEENAILPFGVPIRPSFYDKISRQEAEEKLNLSLDPNKRAVLLIGKRSGLGQVYKSIKALSRHDDLEIICLYGSNQKLKKNVERLQKHSPASIHIFDFNSEYIMALPDVIVGKMGGLSSTEAMTKRVPVVCMGYSPKPEYSNLQYFKSRGTAVEVSKSRELYPAIMSMNVDEFKANCEGLRKENSALNIFVHAHKLIDKNN